MDREEKKQLLRRKQLARFRLRCLCRKVIVNAYWLSAVEDTTMGSNPRRNINIIVRRSGKRGSLSLKEKSIFNKANHDRTTEEKEQLKQLICSLKCFEMIPPNIREDLVEICNFLYCGPERVILREGHRASAIYFLLDGEINVSKRTYSIELGKEVDDVQYALIPGDFFGVDGLILGNRRAVTCTAAIHAELLYIYKEDLTEELQSSFGLLWEQIRTSLKRFDYYFGHFTDQQIIECCTFSKLRKYELDAVVYDEDERKRNTSFFLLSGKCSILQYLKMKYKIINNQKYYTLLDEDENNMESKKERKTVIDAHASENIKNEFASTDPDISSIISAEELIENEEKSFVNIATLSAGSIFGLGERIKNRSIVANNIVQCLEIPRFWLLQRSQNIGNIWQRTKIFYNRTIPSREMVFDDFVRSYKWSQYKDKTINELFHIKSKL